MKKIAVTLGDPSGIGPEIVIKSLLQNEKIRQHCLPVIFGHRQIIEYQLQLFRLKGAVMEIKPPFEIDKPQPSTLYCFAPTELSDIPPVGQINPTAGKLAFSYIESAIPFLLNRELDAMATAPINKKAMRQGQVPYLDHTEILTRLTKSQHTMTLFVTGNLRIFFLTRHIPFRDISSNLNRDEIVENLKHAADHLKKLGIKQPRLALAALNPHAGESGMFGQEEREILIPAVADAQEQGLDVSGPIAADSVFQLTKEGRFDAVLSLYHDQGHIAAKTYDFYRTVSFTMGLPFLRTSVDHGTAMEIAGQNSANPLSMQEAILAAAVYAW